MAYHGMGFMVSKQIYWKCVDCNSMINDENMHEIDDKGCSLYSLAFGNKRYMEFCYGCMNYNPEVVIAYE